MYKVIKAFTDLQDSVHPYEVGDTFPRSGLAVSEARFAELAGSENKQGVPLIQLVEETADKPEEKPKKTRTRKAAEK